MEHCMYSCEICQAASKPGVAKLRHVVTRPNGQIEKEIAVCPACQEELRYWPYEVVLARKRPEATRLLPSVDGTLGAPVEPIQDG